MNRERFVVELIGRNFTVLSIELLSLELGLREVRQSLPLAIYTK